MKKVLMVSLAFPPLPVVGIYRVSKFCKYLPEINWKPYVLTEKIRDVKVNKDWATLKDIEDKTEIIRTINFQPFYWWDNRAQTSPAPNLKTSVNGSTPGEMAIWQRAPLRLSPKRIVKSKIQLLRKILTVPDARLAWIPQAILPGLWLILHRKIDLIFSSSPPPTNHILGYLLSIFSGRPHVVDYRDLWTLNGGYFMRKLPGFLQKHDTFWERTVLRHCRGVVVATSTFRDKMVAGFGDIDIEEKLSVIYNGVDEADYENLDLSLSLNDRFTINYFGNLYGFRDPSLFLCALAEWLKSHPEFRQKVRVCFWGGHSANYMAMVSRHELEDIVTFNGRIPQQEVIRRMFQTDLLLLIQGLDPRISDAIPTKLFEYMVAQKPILAFFPESEAADILREQDEHLVVTEPDPSIIIQYLQERFEIWMRSKEPPALKPRIPPQFSRKMQARQLADFLEQVLQSHA